jgi:hypothetical protein
VHRLACLSGGGEEGSSSAYVAEVFDELADTFEDKLVNHLDVKKNHVVFFGDDSFCRWENKKVGCELVFLASMCYFCGIEYIRPHILDHMYSFISAYNNNNNNNNNNEQYRVPWLLLEMMDKHVSTACCTTSSPPPHQPHQQTRRDLGTWKIVDLGCGSGLCGRLFKKYTSDTSSSPPASSSLISSGNVSSGAGAGRMIGVDLSSKMIQLCEKEGSYDALYVEDIHDTLTREDDKSIDLILSADTFIYVGDLKR